LMSAIADDCVHSLLSPSSVADVDSLAKARGHQFAHQPEPNRAA